MHFEVLVEDQSGQVALKILLKKILSPTDTFTVHAYKGIGRIPKHLKSTKSASNRILLDSLPKLLRGYGRTFAGYGSRYNAAVIVVCDLDTKCLVDFRKELLAILDLCDPCPVTRFCLAIEEGEAWLLGDVDAIRMAYPDAREEVLRSYVPDSVCGTWEKLADAVYPGGAGALSSRGWQSVGAEKAKWAELISPHISVKSNASPSFQYFRSKLLELAATDHPS